MDPVQQLGLGIPVILLGAIWGAFGLVLKVFELLNERRDAILRMQKGIDNDFGWQSLLWNDWIWLWIGTCAFLVTITGILLFIPQFFSNAEGIDATLLQRTRQLCWAVAVLPGFSTIGFLFGGIMDLRKMLSFRPPVDPPSPP